MVVLIRMLLYISNGRYLDGEEIIYVDVDYAAYDRYGEGLVN